MSSHSPSTGDEPTEPGTLPGIGGDSERSKVARAGRFVVIDEIGRGGMGTVYRAYDPTLDRKIALKVLRAGRAGSTDARRLEREAVALARLSHPNVVTIYEVGTRGEEIFIAMEYVDGPDLRRWAEQHPVGTRSRLLTALRLLRQAGRGLAAAHRADLVHRDFKPSNVLVGSDGRARVADFGLVRGGDALSRSGQMERTGDPVPVDDEADRAPVRDDLLVTEAGRTLGTPAFMPPEQQRGRRVDARADVFSFCVASWSLLFGAMPWRGVFPDPEGGPPQVPDGAPGWLVDVLRRGLEADPTMRYPGMEPLLAALRKDPRRRRVVAGAVVGAGLIGAAGFVGFQRYDAGLCTDGPSDLEAVWNDATRRELAAVMVENSPEVGEDTWARTDARLDAFASAWASSYADACDSARRQGTMSDATFDATRSCLALELAELRAALDVLETTGEVAVDRAVDVARMVGVDRDCAHPQAQDVLPLEEDPLLHDGVLVAFEGLRKTSMLRYGAYKGGLARAAFEAIEDVDHPVIQRERTFVTIRAHAYRDQFGALETTGRPAYWTALAAGDNVRAAALAQIFARAAVDQNRLEAAELWLDHARALHSGASADARAYKLEEIASEIWLIRSDLERAQLHAERALARAESVHGHDSLEALETTNNLGRVLLSRHRYAEAATLCETVVRLAREHYGPDSTRVAISLANLAGPLGHLERHDEALVVSAKALAVLEARLGADDARTQRYRATAAVTELNAGRIRSAVARMEDADARYRRTEGASQFDVLMNRSNLVEGLGALGRRDEALALANEVEREIAVDLGAEHAFRGALFYYVGVLRLETGALGDAASSLVDAHAILDATFGAAHRNTAQVRVAQARVAQARGSADVALDLIAPIIERSAPDDSYPEALAMRARLHEEAGEHAIALSEIDRALDANRSYKLRPFLRAQRVTILRRLGEDSEADAELSLGLTEVADLESEHPLAAAALRATAKE